MKDSKLVSALQKVAADEKEVVKWIYRDPEGDGSNKMDFDDVLDLAGAALQAPSNYKVDPFTTSEGWEVIALYKGNYSKAEEELNAEIHS